MEQLPNRNFPSGLSSKPPDDFVGKGFWCCVLAIGHMMHRLVVPYQKLPWRLAVLCDTAASISKKQNVADWFMNLNACCLDVAFSRKVQQMATNAQDLLPGMGDTNLNLQLRSSFQSKNSNVTVENNFARAQTAQQATRGNPGMAASLAARHILAECKRAHLQDCCCCTQNRYDCDSAQEPGLAMTDVPASMLVQMPERPDDEGPYHKRAFVSYHQALCRRGLI